jgi:hypothetical protein
MTCKLRDKADGTLKSRNNQLVDLFHIGSNKLLNRFQLIGSGLFSKRRSSSGQANISKLVLPIKGNLLLAALTAMRKPSFDTPCHSNFI